MNTLWKMFCILMMSSLITLLIKKECTNTFTFIAFVGIISYGYCLVREALRDVIGKDSGSDKDKGESE